MPQVAFLETPPQAAHLIIGSPLSTGLTLCGHRAVGFGDNLAQSQDKWKPQDVAWCDACVRAYTGE